MKFALLTKENMYNLYGKKIEILPKVENNKHTAYIEFTSGCPKESCCLYCNFYRNAVFKRKSEKEIFNHIENVADFHKKKEHNIKRVFLGAGDCFSLKQGNNSDLKKFHIKLLEKIRSSFPDFSKSSQTYKWNDYDYYDTHYYEDENIEKSPVEISSFISTRTILDYGTDDINRLKNKGLKYLYWGVESGSDNVLKIIKKGCTSNDITEAGEILNSIGVNFTAIILVGAAGHDLYIEHVQKTSDILKKLQPAYISFSLLEIFPDTPYSELVKKGKLTAIKDKNLTLQKKLIKNNLDILEYFDEEYHV